MERLDKYLANAGIGTRTEVKKYIRSGRVTVNGSVVKSSDMKIAEDNDQICFDQTLVSLQRFEYHMLYKPQNCVTATEDHHDKTVMDYITSGRKAKLFPVGRLDKDTEGLLLITDDGDLAHNLLAPKKHVSKTYFARVSGQITEESRQAFESGLNIGDEKLTAPASLEITAVSQDTTDTLVTISEGRFHQIKRMFHAIGNEVLFLKRLSMGPLTLDPALMPGQSRMLSPQEIAALRGES